MSIVKKLGIDKDYRGYVNCVELERLQKQRDEMLEALIKSRKFMDKLPSDWFSEVAAMALEHQIQKATGKSWEEIKEKL